jgi:hypothetical protein
MNLDDFKAMSNAKLKSFCAKNEIKVDAKNVSKPTKKEYVAAIDKAGFIERVLEYDEIDVSLNDPLEELDQEDVEDFLNQTEEEENGLQEKEKNAPKKEMTRSQKRSLQYKELMVLKRAIVTPNETNQTRIKNQVEYCTWGNRLLGHHTDKFPTGTPWHFREGALRNLRNMKVSRSIQDDEGNTIRFETVPAYIVQELDPLTKKEVETIARRQIIRDSSIDSLI